MPRVGSSRMRTSGLLASQRAISTFCWLPPERLLIAVLGLANNPDVLILDEPTRGIDVGAKYEIYCIIADLAKQGKSIIMISSEMSEIIGMSNRVMVMCDGRITGFIDGKDATQENIMALATQFETAPEAAAANQ